MASSNNQANINVEHLLKKLESEYVFISSVLDRVPSIYSQETDDASEDEENPSSLSRANAIISKQGNATRAYTVQELQERLDALKSKQGFRNLVKKKNLETKLKNKKKKDDKNNKPNPITSTKKLQRNERNKQVFNSEGKMVFSKFDFSGIGGSSHEVKKKKNEPKDPKKILEKLKQKKETLKKLKEEGQDAKVSEFARKEAWSNAFKRADGVLVRDDPELLKKSIKRQEDQKKVSARKWASREYGVKKTLKERVDKRESNIQARINAKKDKKKARAIKKGRYVPGFN